MYIGCILPVSIYMCTICLIGFIVAWQNSKSVSRKMHAFFQNAISCALLYSSFVWTNIQALYIQNSVVYLSNCRVFCKIQELRNPTILLPLIWIYDLYEVLLVIDNFQVMQTMLGLWIEIECVSLLIICESRFSCLHTHKLMQKKKKKKIID